MTDLEEIKNLVESKTRLNLKRNTRKREYVYARALFFKLCDRYLDVTSSALGNFLGKDHATVLHHRKTTYNYIEKEPRFFKAYKYICTILDKDIKDLDDEIIHDACSLQQLNYKEKFLQNMIKAMHSEIKNRDKKIKSLSNKIGQSKFEDHELRYRDLPEDKKDIFRTRVDAILKML